MSLTESTARAGWHYKNSDDDIKLKEYGRVVERIAKKVLEVEDREERTRKAYTLIELMRHFNPVMREGEDYDQMLWDHLYYITDFRLEVDAPYPVPEVDIRRTKPQSLDYPSYQSKYRNYGENLENMVKEVAQLEDEQQRMGGVNYLGRLMKSFTLSWTNDFIDDDLVLDQIINISEGKLKPTIDKMRKEDLLDLYVKVNTNNNGGSKKKGKGKKKRRKKK